jgi:valyl-tRNA synthetase
MKPLAKPALEAVRTGKIKFYPQRWMKVYINWMENIQDWCISRQIWWGHRIPLWYCRDCQKLALASVDAPKECPICKSFNLKQDEDVLDTWFSSWLWPFATFYWPLVKGQSPSGGGVPCEELNYFYPTSVLVTAPEIIFFWVARMIMAGLEFMKDIPFRDVYIHGTVRDIEGKKMSKSLGNIIDPLEIIDEFGSDALRFSLISVTSQGQDIFLSRERFQQGRNFANKIWNASRFVLMNLEPGHIRTDLCAFAKNEDLNIINRWILSRFYSVLKKVSQNLDIYRLNEAANTLYGFFWHEFCDWYLELAKPILVNREQSTENRNTQIVMYKVLEKFLRILHPFMPFITEEIWRMINRTTSIMVSPWPHIQEQMVDKKLEKQAQSLFDIITQIRNLRSVIEIKPEQRVRVSVYPHSKPKYNLVKDNAGLIENLAKLQDLELLTDGKRPHATISAIIEDIDIYLHFSGLLDIAREKAKIRDKMKSLEGILSSKKSRISNPEFIKKAPKEIIDKEKEDITKLNDELKRFKKMSDELR